METEEPPSRSAGEQRVLLAADMHLAGQEPALVEQFLDALAAASPGASELFLLGDLFEAWIGDDTPEPAAGQLAVVLRSLAAAGIRIRVLRGNRDFLLGQQPLPALLPSYAERAGFELCEEPLVIELHGRRAVLCHGDSLCTDDIEYQRFRALSRDPHWQRDFLAQPIEARLETARSYREASRLSQLGRGAQHLSDVNQAAVNALLDATGADILIHGHTHQPAVHRWQHGARVRERWVLPDWRQQPRLGGFLCIDATGWHQLGDWQITP